MAGRGPAPKDPSTRARRNRGPEMRVIQGQRAPQPPLPKFKVRNPDTGRLVNFVWPEATKRWWKEWGESPLAEDFGATDWSFLLDTAVLHAKYWTGNTSLAGELRLREAKFGATPEDRLRLRIQYELADEAEDRGQRRRAKRRAEAPKDDPRKVLRAVK